MPAPLRGARPGFGCVCEYSPNKLGRPISGCPNLLGVMVLFITTKQCNIKVFAWVILSNHYHLLIHVRKKNDLVRFIKSFHGKSAIEFNRLDSRLGRKVWANYWDHGIRNAADFWKHFNYIHHNPIKHGYSSNMQDYQFSSYNEWITKKGVEWIESCFSSYPIADFTSTEL